MDNPGSELRNTGENYSSAAYKGSRPLAKEKPQQQSPRDNLGLDQSDTEIYHETDIDLALQANAIAVSFSQHCFRGKAQKPSERPILLDFDLYPPTEGGNSGPKKCWTLEGLKEMMEKRMSAWRLEDEGGLTAQPRSQQVSWKPRILHPRTKQTSIRNCQERRCLGQQPAMRN
ncbi:hypothetical protein BDW71DRAFT_162521 [Aspergillus fruticulosus]